MSTITDIFNQVNTLLSNTYSSTHLKMVDPYNIDLNDEFILNRGYGFFMGPAINTQRLLSCQLSLERQVVISLSVINRGTDRDVDIRESAELLLLEDHFNLVQAVEADATLQGLTAKIAYQGDAGIERVYLDKSNYIYMQSSFAVEYFEDLS